MVLPLALGDDNVKDESYRVGASCPCHTEEMHALHVWVQPFSTVGGGCELASEIHVLDIEFDKGVGCFKCTKRALHNPGCSWGLNPPVSSRLRAM